MDPGFSLTIPASDVFMSVVLKDPLNKWGFLAQVRLSRHQLSSHAIRSPAERDETIPPNLLSARFCCVQSTLT